jgi:hypothetical protein
MVVAIAIRRQVVKAGDHLSGLVWAERKAQGLKSLRENRDYEFSPQSGNELEMEFSCRLFSQMG